MNLRKLLPCLAAVVVAICAAGAVRADAIVNGGFETGGLTGWWIGSYGGGAAVVTSPLPFEGSYCASVWGTSTGGWGAINTSFHANAGDILSFECQGTGIPDAFGFDANVGSAIHPTHDILNGWGFQMLSTQWQYESYQFNVSDNYDLEFYVSGPADFYIDNVQLTPEPASMGLLAFGTLVLLCRRSDLIQK